MEVLKEKLETMGITPKELFQKADKDKTNTIDVYELKELFFSIFSPKKSSLKKVLTYMKILDGNQNGEITYSEFMSALGQQDREKSKKMTDNFALGFANRYF